MHTTVTTGTIRATDIARSAHITCFGRFSRVLRRSAATAAVAATLLSLAPSGASAQLAIPRFPGSTPVTTRPAQPACYVESDVFVQMEAYDPGNFSLSNYSDFVAGATINGQSPFTSMNAHPLYGTPTLASATKLVLRTGTANVNVTLWGRTTQGAPDLLMDATTAVPVGTTRQWIPLRIPNHPAVVVSVNLVPGRYWCVSGR